MLHSVDVQPHPTWCSKPGSGTGEQPQLPTFSQWSISMGFNNLQFKNCRLGCVSRAVASRLKELIISLCSSPPGQPGIPWPVLGSPIPERQTGANPQWPSKWSWSIEHMKRGRIVFGLF